MNGYLFDCYRAPCQIGENGLYIFVPFNVSGYVTSSFGSMTCLAMFESVYFEFLIKLGFY